jgi:hypothetical protein
MDPTSLVPPTEAIPAPHWLFEGLGVLTLSLHLLLVNVVLGGVLLFTYRLLLAKPVAAGESTSVEPGYVNAVPTVLALAINLGVAPLLFVQVTYGHLIYSSSVLMGVFWLAVVPLLIVAYYGVYLVRGGASRPRLRRLLAPLVALLLLAIAFVFVNNMSLMLQPARWVGYAQNRAGTLLNLGDPTLWPRYLHFVVASLAVAGLFLALREAWRARRGRPHDAIRRAAGLRLFGVATLVQVVVGLWFLFALPVSVRAGLLGGDALRTAVLSLGIALALAAIGAAFTGRLRATVALLVITVVTMVTLRLLVRLSYLSAHFDPAQLEVTTQTSPMVAFFAVLLAGLATIAWMLRAALRGRAAS